MIGLNKSMGQWAPAGMVAFKILDTAGTPTITEVFPANAAGDISIVDGGDGDYDITIQNFKGVNAMARVFANAETISLFTSPVDIAFSGDSLTFTIKVEADDSTATDSSVGVLVVSY